MFNILFISLPFIIIYISCIKACCANDTSLGCMLHLISSYFICFLPRERVHTRELVSVHRSLVTLYKDEVFRARRKTVYKKAAQRISFFDGDKLSVFRCGGVRGLDSDFLGADRRTIINNRRPY